MPNTKSTSWFRPLMYWYRDDTVGSMEEVEKEKGGGGGVSLLTHMYSLAYGMIYTHTYTTARWAYRHIG